MVSLTAFKRHLASHLEQLALFALPTVGGYEVDAKLAGEISVGTNRSRIVSTALDDAEASNILNTSFESTGSPEDQSRKDTVDLLEEKMEQFAIQSPLESTTLEKGLSAPNIDHRTVSPDSIYQLDERGGKTPVIECEEKMLVTEHEGKIDVKERKGKLPVSEHVGKMPMKDKDSEIRLSSNVSSSNLQFAVRGGDIQAKNITGGKEKATGSQTFSGIMMNMLSDKSPFYHCQIYQVVGLASRYLKEMKLGTP
ncbi:hypothetical protein CC86DRAFT_378590 [Ophiobolus disseminans]|uniref:Uncharacterized protein n=1 Tax=Ophiobolus disseminans TaxID=1469910 RepID=A0A6A7AFB7_9PLEO|nr:hypothetical protein CC86DRAFT_378590 [Ophiobolus disseminans]